MQCDRTQRLLADYSVGGLRPRQRKAVEEHIARCASCRAELDALDRAGELVSDLPLEQPPDDLWRGIESEITAMPRPVGLGARLAGWWREGARGPRPALIGWAAGLAAAALVVLGSMHVGDALFPESRGPKPVQVAREMDAESASYVERHIVMGWRAERGDDAAFGLALASLPAEEGEAAR